MVCCRAFEGKVPPVNPDKGADLIAALNAEVGDLCAQYLDLMERMKIREAVTKALAVSAAGNKFFQDTQPWVLAKSDPEHAGTVVAAALGVVKVRCCCLCLLSAVSNRMSSVDLPGLKLYNTL